MSRFCIVGKLLFCKTIGHYHWHVFTEKRVTLSRQMICYIILITFLTFRTCTNNASWIHEVEQLKYGSNTLKCLSVDHQCCTYFGNYRGGQITWWDKGASTATLMHGAKVTLQCTNDVFSRTRRCISFFKLKCM